MNFLEVLGDWLSREEEEEVEERCIGSVHFHRVEKTPSHTQSHLSPSDESGYLHE